jgi:hypothetical protein
MNDELDPGLRRLFAATADYPADEAFVAEVTAKTVGLRPTGHGMPAALVRGAVVGVLAAALGLALAEAAGPITSLVTATPFGPVTGLALLAAGFVCVRALAPLANLTRL